MYVFNRQVLALAAIAALSCCLARAEVTEVAPGVYFRLGDVERGQANGGYVVCDNSVVVIEAPNPEASAEMLREIRKLTDRPVRHLIITHGHWDHDRGADAFIEKGITVIVHENLRRQYAQSGKAGSILGVSDKLVLTVDGKTIEVFTRGTAHSPTDVFVRLPEEGVLFTGDAVVNMPTAWLGECDIENWIDTLASLSKLGATKICPGHGPAGGPEIVEAFRKYLVDLRDEVAFQVAQGRSLETTLKNADVPGRRKYCLDDNAFADHVKAVYRQLTAELPPPPPRIAPRALALIGDHYHRPAYIRPPLEAAFKEIGMPVCFVYDVTKLTAANLRGFSLLVVLRDGMIWPDNDRRSVWWLTDEQQKALDEFIGKGGGYLSLHNSTALKCLGPQQNPYRDILGGSYNGHGAVDEKFTVHVINKDHPVTRGVSDYAVVDERHDPKIHADDAIILLEAVSGDKRSVNGYVRLHGKGRICHLANGHNAEALSNPSMQKLIANAALWCCGVEK